MKYPKEVVLKDAQEALIRPLAEADEPLLHLLAEPRRLYGSVRRYTEGDVARVRFIKSAQRLGFSLDEIADLLRLEDGSHCTEAREQAERKLADVRARLADLKRIEGALQGLVERCCATSGQVQCPLIAALQAA